MLIHNKNEHQRKNAIVVLSDSLIMINDKVQAIDALYTIYTVADIRTHAISKELSLSSFKVVEDYKASQLKEEDYIDMRRLIRNIWYFIIHFSASSSAVVIRPKVKNANTYLNIHLDIVSDDLLFKLNTTYKVYS